MSSLRDYQQWHRAYDDPNSELSWRLDKVQGYLRDALDQRSGPVRVVSSCSGDGRDLIDVLAARPDTARVTATLVEIHPEIAEQARARAAAAGLAHVDVRTADAARSDSFLGAVPADVVLLVGILGNISDADLARTVRAAPQLCARGATLVWSRGRDRSDRNDVIRAMFAGVGFVELDYASHPAEDGPALGVVRYDGVPQALLPGQQWFTFLR